MSAEAAVVLYPSPAIGHLISMVELGKLLLSHRPDISLAVHVIISSQAYDAGSTAPYISAVSASVPSLTFHHLPPTSLPPDFTTNSPHCENLAFKLIRLNNPNLRATLLSISAAHRTVSALVMDFFCHAASHVAQDLSIPCYYFFTSAAGFLIFLYFPTLHEKYSDEAYTNPGTLLELPGIPLLPIPDVAKPLRDRDDDAYVEFLESSMSMRESSGVIVNTFEELELRAIQAIIEGNCVPEKRSPPLYCIGPLISDRGSWESSGGETPAKCLEWLNEQPSRSVVFLCFGSLGAFSSEQLREIAIGLEKSGQRFLWVVRSPPPDPTHKVASKAQPEPDLNSLLPEGFLGRTADRGLVIKSWAPQVAILQHGSTGGFVTHCGWNSTLEAVCAGKPMIAWPLYAEQRHNRLLMVAEEMKIALPIEESEQGFVCSAEVERRVRELMDSPKGEAERERIQAVKEAAEAALKPGGSSLRALTRLFDSWKLATVG